MSKPILYFSAWLLLTGASPKVGDVAPDFELSDAAGRAYKLSDFRSKSAVVLEFFRSGDW